MQMINPTIQEKAFHNIVYGPSLSYLMLMDQYGYLTGEYKKPTDQRYKDVKPSVPGAGYDRANTPKYTGWEKDGNYLYHSGSVCINSTKDYPGDYYSFVIAETKELRIVDQITKNTYPVFTSDLKAPTKRVKMLKAIAKTLTDDPDNIIQYVPVKQSLPVYVNPALFMTAYEPEGVQA